MSYKSIIEVCDICKRFEIYQNPIDRLKQFFYSWIFTFSKNRAPKKYYSEFTALENVSFNIRRGETVGVIGCNGSGKSTLLQVICGILKPNSGSLRVDGKIAALLELGSGFNLDFTGKENIYINGALLGLSRPDIDKKYQEIILFADIGSHIDAPVKTYSSGMIMRLAFSVAIHVDPEILIIDEALTVGDELFQRKCFSRIEEIKSRGATIFFVSHSGAQIVELCDRAILLDGGKLLSMGEPKKILSLYQKLLYAPNDQKSRIRDEIYFERDKNISLSEPNESLELNNSMHSEVGEGYDPHLISSSLLTYESHGAEIIGPEILNDAGVRVNTLIRGRTYTYKYEVLFNRDIEFVSFGMMIKNKMGFELGGATTANLRPDRIPVVKTSTLYAVEFQFTCLLNTGTYFLNAGVLGDINGVDTFIHRLVDVVVFNVLPFRGSNLTGAVDLRFKSYASISKM